MEAKKMLNMDESVFQAPMWGHRFLFCRLILCNLER